MRKNFRSRPQASGLHFLGSDTAPRVPIVLPFLQDWEAPSWCSAYRPNVHVLSLSLCQAVGVLVSPVHSPSACLAHDTCFLMPFSQIQPDLDSTPPPLIMPSWTTISHCTPAATLPCLPGLLPTAQSWVCLTSVSLSRFKDLVLPTICEVPVSWPGKEPSIPSTK